MSLNRCEEALLRYLNDNADEKRFWSARVNELERVGGAREGLATTLDSELREYAAERDHHGTGEPSPFGGGKVSMRNLAEHLFAVWTPPKGPRKPNRAPR